MIRQFVAGILWSAIGELTEWSWNPVFTARNYAAAQRVLRAVMDEAA